MTLPLMCLLHWYFMPLYAAPILLVLGSTIRETVRQRHKADQAVDPVTKARKASLR